MYEELQLSRRQCPGINVQRLAKILHTTSALKGKWDEKQEESANACKGMKKMLKITHLFLCLKVGSHFSQGLHPL
jgi:hypothetical protein